MPHIFFDSSNVGCVNLFCLKDAGKMPLSRRRVGDQCLANDKALFRFVLTSCEKDTVRLSISISALSGSSTCRPPPCPLRSVFRAHFRLLRLPASPSFRLVVIHSSPVRLSASFHATVRGMIKVRTDAHAVREVLTGLLSPCRSRG